MELSPKTGPEKVPPSSSKDPLAELQSLLARTSPLKAKPVAHSVGKEPPLPLQLALSGTQSSSRPTMASPTPSIPLLSSSTKPKPLIPQLSSSIKPKPTTSQLVVKLQTSPVRPEASASRWLLSPSKSTTGKRPRASVPPQSPSKRTPTLPQPVLYDRERLGSPPKPPVFVTFGESTTATSTPGRNNTPLKASGFTQPSPFLGSRSVLSPFRLPPKPWAEPVSPPKSLVPEPYLKRSATAISPLKTSGSKNALVSLKYTPQSPSRTTRERKRQAVAETNYFDPYSSQTPAEENYFDPYRSLGSVDKTNFDPYSSQTALDAPTRPALGSLSPFKSRMGSPLKPTPRLDFSGDGEYSPVKTPRPEQPLAARSNTDLDRSARRRAVRSLYTQLVDETGESDEELVEEIIAALNRPPPLSPAPQLSVDTHLHASAGSPLKRSVGESPSAEAQHAEDGTMPVERHNLGGEAQHAEDGTMLVERHNLGGEAQHAEDGSAPLKRHNLGGEAQHAGDGTMPVERHTTRHKLLSAEAQHAGDGFVPTAVPATLTDEETRRFDDRALFLDGSEGYFEQSKTRNKKTSGNTLVMLPTASDLEYPEFNRLVRLSQMLYYRERQRLSRYYCGLYQQWKFELSQGFNLVFYGIGLKRELVMDFVQTVGIPTLVVNGYNPHCGLKEVVTQLGRHFMHRHLPSHHRDVLPALARFLADRAYASAQVLVVVHNIDGEALRDDTTQTLLAQLGSLPGIAVVLTIDHINAPVIWDAAKLTQFNYVWHDLTTFATYTVETSFRDALSVGKSSKFLGLAGATYVLSSLTANARKLYSLLLGVQLQTMADDYQTLKDAPGTLNTFRGKSKHSVEFKRLLQLCREEFVASNELNFRTMLVEFVEHKMLRLVKDPNGVEIVYVPFNYEEMTRLVETKE